VDGLDQLVLRTYEGTEIRLPFKEAAYSAYFGGNPEFAPKTYRIGYSSMVTPPTVYDYHPGKTGSRYGECWRSRRATTRISTLPSGG
jgi:protease II